jgi:predicted transposase/invertase (TIGR01784 family)
LDIFVETQAKERINIEIQVAEEQEMPERSLLYWSDLYRTQALAGTEYTQLNRAITINLLDFELDFRDSTDPYHSTYHLTEDANGRRLTNVLEMHFMELPKWRQTVVSVEEVVRHPLEKWLAFLDIGDNEQIRTALEGAAMADPTLEKALEELEELGRDPENWAAYISLKKTIFDAAAKEARQKRLLKEAREQSLEQGLEQGEHHRAVTTARNLLRMGMTANQVAKATDLPLEEVQKLKEELQ